MFGLSLGHILILLVVLLLFGARRLPELGSSLGKGLRAFKRGLEDDDSNKISQNQGNQNTQNPNTQSRSDSDGNSQS